MQDFTDLPSSVGDSVGIIPAAAEGGTLPKVKVGCGEPASCLPVHCSFTSVILPLKPTRLLENSP